MEVILFNGETANINDCVKIAGEYYRKHRDCFKFEDLWYRNNSPSVTIDNATGEYALRRTLNFGIVRFKDENPIFGHFSGDAKYLRKVFLPFKPEYLRNRYFRKLMSTTINNGVEVYILEEKTIPTNIYKERYMDGIFYSKDEGKSDRFFTSKGLMDGYNTTLPYEAKYSLKERVEHYNLNPIPTKGLSLEILKYYSYLEPYTYGIEFETNTGFIHPKVCLDHGLIELRDGSIGGIEFATIPLKLPEQLELLKSQTNLLKERTIISARDSTHIHIGGYPLNKEKIFSLFTTLKAIEDEMYSIVPYGFRDTSAYKRRSYNNPLPTINSNLAYSPDKNFNILFDKLASGAIEFPGFNVIVEHPKDVRGEHKWYIEERYTWCNLISLLFGSKRTVEFRSHPCTINFNKLIYWIFVCTGILMYADKMSKIIVTKSPRTFKLNFYDIFYNVYPKDLADILLKYTNFRKEEFFVANKNGDNMGIKDVSLDSIWKFESKLIHV